MNIAVLFDSEDPKYGGVYGWAIRDTILKTGVLQKSNRHMKVAIGDIGVMPQGLNEVQAYRQAIILNSVWHKLVYPKVLTTYIGSIFVWVIYNTTKTIATELHTALSQDSSYLGLHSVELSYLPHLAAYHLVMIPTYRITGDTCRIFYSMSDNERQDPSERIEVLKLGFNSVTWEDTGAHQTIYDDFDTQEHFTQVKEFELAISPYLFDGDDGAGELSMLIGDFNPKLFTTLGALVRTFGRAKNEEEFAQVGLSGRRYMEQLADVLFVADDTLYRGMDVTQGRSKNRLKAYIDKTIPISDMERSLKIAVLNKAINEMFEEVNTILHAKASKERVGKCFADIAKLTATLLTLNPKISRNPYFAFSDKVDGFLG